jgi:diguanylate cyclase (GGDEF)-like protein
MPTLTPRSHFDLSEYPGSPYAAELRSGSLCRLRFAPPLEREFVQAHLGQMSSWVRLFRAMGLPLAILICIKELLELRLWDVQVAPHLGLFLPGALAMITVFFMTGLLFRQAVFTAIAVLVTFTVTASLSGLHTGAVLELSGFLVLTGIMASVAHRGIEQSSRRSFLEAGLIGELATRDGLTGLLNRRSFDEQLARAWQQGMREHCSVAVLMFDVDYFKEYNDRYGHLAGDEALRRVARIIKRIARRPLDCAARYGGEEFVVVLFDITPDRGEKLAGSLRRAVERLGLEHDRSKVSGMLTVSVGVAGVTPTPGRSCRGAIQLADEALYRAKAAGRNRVVGKGSDEYLDLKTGRFPRLAVANRA